MQKMHISNKLNYILVEVFTRKKKKPGVTQIQLCYPGTAILRNVVNFS